MSLLTGALWGKLTELPHPELNRQGCINCHRRHGCSACAEACPHGVIGENHSVQSWSGCTDCQRCVAACPTRAIAPSRSFVEQLYALKSGPEARLWLGCEGSGRENDVTRGCLREWPWEALAWLSFHRILILDLSPCGDCTQEGCRAAVREALKRVHDLLGWERFQARVHLVHDAETEKRPNREISRRELFQRGADWTKSGAESLLRQMPLLDSGELHLDGLSLRQLLHREMKRSQSSFLWQVPRAGAGCNGCGDCVKQCPSKALHLGEQALVLDVARCTACQGCAAACTKKVITGLMWAKVEDLTPVRLCGVERIVCTQCGAVLRKASHNGLCPACQRRRMQSILRGEKEETP